MDDALSLIREARAAGVELAVGGDPRRLRIKSPRAAEGLALQVQAQRIEVIAALESLCAWGLEDPPDGGFDAGGRGWCSACRDAEQTLQAVPPALTAGRDLRAAWAGAVRELGELLGHPELNFKPGVAVSLGPIGWQQFVAHASVEDMALVLALLRVRVADLPRPDGGAL